MSSDFQPIDHCFILTLCMFLSLSQTLPGDLFVPRRGWARSFLLLFGMYSHIVIVHYMTNEEETLEKKMPRSKRAFLGTVHLTGSSAPKKVLWELKHNVCNMYCKPGWHPETMLQKWVFGDSCLFTSLYLHSA